MQLTSISFFTKPRVSLSELAPKQTRGWSFVGAKSSINDGRASSAPLSLSAKYVSTFDLVAANSRECIRALSVISSKVFDEKLLVLTEYPPLTEAAEDCFAESDDLF